MHTIHRQPKYRTYIEYPPFHFEVKKNPQKNRYGLLISIAGDDYGFEDNIG